MIEKAEEEKSNDAIFKWWLARYPLYTEKNYESFEDFKEKLKPKKIQYDNRDMDEIMEELKQVESKFRKEE